MLTLIKLESPYLIFLGDVTNVRHAKTASGIAYWSKELCIGQMRLPGCNVDLGLPDLRTEEAVAANARTAIIGIAEAGGKLQDHWLPALIELAEAGIEIASGLHSKLADMPQLVDAAAKGGSRLIDVRTPPVNLSVGTGAERTGKRLLTVGTDCATGKKYTALAIHRELVKQGVKATFRATGQTGIMISGEGIPIDSVVADFISGAAEVLTPDNDNDHWDVIEGQGSLHHPSYAGVTLGLIHGSQPDAIILCHDVGRSKLLGREGTKYMVPSISAVIDSALTAARLTNPDCVCVGISVNTSSLSCDERAEYLDKTAKEHGLPAVDPVATGIELIAKSLLEKF